MGSTRLVDQTPAFAEQAIESYRAAVPSQPAAEPHVTMILNWLGRIMDVDRARRMLIVGCGPFPEAVRILNDRGHSVVAVEPVLATREAAQGFLGDKASVIEGSAEELPVKSASQDVVVLESVLEHVDSVGRTLGEAHRVLAPGGVAYVSTTNRLLISNGGAEFNVSFFPWLPNLVKESYVFQHLHYDPSLANYAERPAVHWFTFSELCARGREAGFDRFYSHLDLRSNSPSDFSGSNRARGLKGWLLTRVQSNPWLRALALSQRGGIIFMVKRS